MTTKTEAFDPAAYLDEEDQSGLLDDALATGDANVIAGAIGIVARARGGFLVLERRTGIKRQTLAKSFGPKGNPTVRVLTAALEALGFRLTVAPAAEVDLCVPEMA